jgi:hypothetical protein
MEAAYNLAKNTGDWSKFTELKEEADEKVK